MLASAESMDPRSPLDPSAAIQSSSSSLICRCCGSENVTRRGEKRGRFIARDFRFYVCEECSFQFVEPITDFAIYDDAYYAGKGPDPSVDYEQEFQDYAASPRVFEFQDLFALAKDHLRKLPQVAPETAAWLDFGCGAGGLLKYTRDRAGDLVGRDCGIRLVGHDVGSYAGRLRAEGFEVLDLEELKSAGSEFDIVSCIEVLEHLPSPRPVIELLARLLKPSGLLLLTTGNMHCPLAKLQGLQFSYCVPEIHVSLSNPGLLAALYRQAGLKPVYMKYDGVIRFRILKSLTHGTARRLSALAHFPLIIRLADLAYGTSAMPCAVKPRNGIY
jgi:SAM-dependent methyltransferase